LRANPLIYKHFCRVVNRPRGRRVKGNGLRPEAGLSYTTTREGDDMKQLVAILTAAMFAATSFAALAQDKGGMDKKAKTEKKMDKKKGKAKADKKKGEGKKSAMEKK
jgi:hypothetical protein